MLNSHHLAHGSATARCCLALHDDTPARAVQDAVPSPVIHRGHPSRESPVRIIPARFDLRLCRRMKKTASAISARPLTAAPTPTPASATVLRAVDGTGTLLAVLMVAVVFLLLVGGLADVSLGFMDLKRNRSVFVNASL